MPLHAADYYVAGQDANAADTSPGTLKQPWKTLAKAAATAKAGDTVWIRGGLYRETLKIKNSGAPNKPITFAAYKSERPIISGADVVSGFVRDGVFWVKKPWDDVRKWDAGWADVSEAKDKSSARLEQIYVNGAMQHQVFSREALRPGTFLWDAKPKTEGGGQLILCPPDNVRDINKALVETPRRGVLSGPWGNWPRGWEEYLQKSGGWQGRTDITPCDYVTLRGLEFRHGLFWFNAGGAHISGRNWTLESCSFRFANAVGLYIGGANALIRNCEISDNGADGIGGSLLKNVLIEDCLTLRNNTREYARTWAGAGNKVGYAENTIVRRLVTGFSRGAGFWFDIDCRNNIIEDCVSVGNFGGIGFFYEISFTGKIQNNVSFANGLGILTAHSADSLVENNVLIGGGTGVSIGGGRTDGAKKYVAANNTVRNNLMLGVAGAQVGFKGGDGDARRKSANNQIVDNLFVTLEGATARVQNVAFTEPKTFESAYPNSSGNRLVSGLANTDAATRARLDDAFGQILAGLRRAEPRLQIPNGTVRLKEIWTLGGRDAVSGYWVEIGKQHVLLLDARRGDTILLLADAGRTRDAVPANLWTFPTDGPAHATPMSAPGAVLSGKAEGPFGVVTGLAAGTRPLTSLLRLTPLGGDKRQSTFREGATVGIAAELTNPFAKKTTFTLSGPGLKTVTFALAPGEKQTTRAEVAAIGGQSELVYNLASPQLGAPLDASVNLRVTRVAKVGFAATSTGDIADVAEIAPVKLDAATQRNALIWDEQSGKIWGGPQDLSARASLSWSDDDGLRVLVHVKDDIAAAGDGMDLFLDSRAEGQRGTNNYAPGTLFVQVAAPTSDQWADVIAIAGKVNLKNGFRARGRKVADGYLLDVRLGTPFFLVKPTAGGVVGFDIALNDADRPNIRHAQLVWHGSEGRNASDPSAFGIVVLEKP